MVKLNVPDMSCGHCVGVITRAIKDVDPGAEIKVDLPGKTVAVTTTAPAQSISAALERAGYPSTTA